PETFDAKIPAVVFLEVLGLRGLIPTLPLRDSPGLAPGSPRGDHNILWSHVRRTAIYSGRLGIATERPEKRRAYGSSGSACSWDQTGSDPKRVPTPKTPLGSDPLRV